MAVEGRKLKGKEGEKGSVGKGRGDRRGGVRWGAEGSEMGRGGGKEG